MCFSLGGCGIAGLGGGGDERDIDEPGLDNTNYPGDAFSSAPVLAPLTKERLDQIGAAVDAVLESPAVQGNRLSLLVVDMETGQEIVARDADSSLKPASNTKLFTTAAAFEIFGEDRRMSTTVVSAEPPMDGVIAGDAVLRGGFDFSWSSSVLESSEVALDELVGQLVAKGISRIDGTLWISGEFLYDGYRFGTYDAEAERLEVAQAVGAALDGANISVGKVAIATSAITGMSTELARFQSPPLSVGGTPLNRLSHNEFADVLARYAARELGGDSSYETWTAEVGQWASSFGAEVLLHDGSGLSHDNRVSARSIVGLLGFMLRRPEGRSWLRTLSIAGVDGTLGSRMVGADTWGRFWGKTGTLSGVIATSGVLFNRYDGRRYLVSIVMNETTASNTETRAAHDAIVEIVAGDHREGSSPDAPRLELVRRVGGSALLAQWTEVEGARGYLVWLSADGKTWSRDQARFVTSGRYRSGKLDGDAVHVRITTVGERGESQPSDVYSAGVGSQRVLVVDGNDRWQDPETVENPMSEGHDFVTTYGRALEGIVGFDTVANELVADSDVALEDYDAVVWMTGEDGVENQALDADERHHIASFLDDGGKLMISGSEIGWDLFANGDQEERKFFGDYLKASYVGDDAGTSRARSTGVVLSSSQMSLGFYTPADLVVRYPDALAPMEGASAALEYAGVNTAAAIAYQGSHSVVYFGFPFESIDNAPDRRRVMAEIVDFFDL